MFRSGARASQASFAGEFLVPSQHGNGFYRVRGVGADHQQETCDCPDFLDRHVPCKHIFFARRWILDSIETKAELLPRDSTRKIPVNWSIYTQCQKEEGRLFPILLRELCAGIQEVARDPNKAGRPPIPLRD